MCIETEFPGERWWAVLRLFDTVRPMHGDRSHRAACRGVLLAFVAATAVSGVSFADEAPKGSAEFFDHFCSECHYEDQSGGLDLSVLTFDPDNRDNFSTWVRAFDRVSAGARRRQKRLK